ncbi:F0F1 ATP synthase subunit epsilon [Paracoccus jiaweipingae]|uniref:F0F1 ATP synthase subunit epsilon n=1 Tax=unclassified Paracoccus (in: a-proteobacteria) TaxID=2688777 RepID=UPI00378AD228
MSGLSLTITTPLTVALRAGGLAALRAEDASGSFGLLQGHADFLTVIEAGVLRWRAADGPWRFAALRGGVMTVTGGQRVDIACREAILADDLAGLEARVARARADQDDAARQVRTHDTQLHARAIRRMMMQLSPSGDTLGLTTGAEP